MRTLLLATLIIFGDIAFAAPIDVGGVGIEVPNPKGFTPVTEAMAELYEFQKLLVTPTNQAFIHFIPMEESAEALSGELPEMERRFSVQTAKGLISASISTSDFEGLKSGIKSQNAEILKQVQDQLPDVMSNISEGVSKQYNVNIALSVSKMLPLPVHLESDRALVYSSIGGYDMIDENGEPINFVVVVTTAFVHIKGRVVFLYSYAGEDDLEWSRRATADWIDSVVNSNPSDVSDSLREAMPSAASGINWSKVADKAIIGAVIGLLLGLVSWVKGRRKAG